MYKVELRFTYTMYKDYDCESCDWMTEKFDKVKYDNEYQKANYDRIIVMAPKGEKQTMKEYAKSQGKSLNAYILDLIHADMESKK